MYQDEILKQLLSDERYLALKSEINTMEAAIEKFLTNILECTAAVAQRDFGVMPH
jgi:hypothetical protein